jgi:hypothetical protein
MKELKRDYKSFKPPMGVFAVRNTRNNRFQIHATRNLKAGMNRLKLEITPPTDPNLDLLSDWKTMGPEAFEIRVLDELKPRDVPGWDPDDDLKELEAMWRERLIAEGGTPY